MKINNLPNQDYLDLIVPETMTIIQVMEVLNRTSKGVVFICDENNVMTATVTDGDIRRHILRGGKLESMISEPANYSFTYVRKEQIDHAQKIMQEKKIRCLPVLDESGCLISTVFLGEKQKQPKGNIGAPVVIMAGGKGTRLYPYTKVLPKALIPVGEISISEHIMNEFMKYGCDDFTMIVNHKKNMIKAYFTEEDIQYHVHFADEDSPLGTGGGLKLLQGKIDQTFFITNCDILIKEDYQKIYNAHVENNNLVTMVCATKKLTIPYGVVKVNTEGRLSSISEKPSFPFLTNTGMYLAEPRIFDYIPENTFIHITDIIETCKNNNENIGIYPISEFQWSDMGQMDEMEKMKKRLHIDE
ncbi:MAG: sugar phosphate nucleotidyltransferase [Eubacteriales bacterium]|nr:sugar phosphate nucleotidyltransferase [Eubacteriales bacterium]